jgi:hypothetical protein
VPQTPDQEESRSFRTELYTQVTVLGLALGMLAAIAQFLTSSRQVLVEAVALCLAAVAGVAVVAALRTVWRRTITVPVHVLVVGAVVLLVSGAGSWAVGSNIARNVSAPGSSATESPTGTPSTSYSTPPSTTLPPTAPSSATSSPSDASALQLAAKNMQVTITDPTTDQTVGVCKAIRGEAWPLREELTLVTVKHRDGGEAWYVERPASWDHPLQLSRWKDEQSFNGADGQDYTVGVYVVPLDEVKREKAKPQNNPTWALKEIPPGWELRADVTVHVDSSKVKPDTTC